MIDRSRDGDELKETFSVLGSTGNVCSISVKRVHTHYPLGLHSEDR